MHTVQYRRWSPPKSPIRVEFTPDVLREVRAETLKDHDRGFLYGLRLINEVRVLAARRTPHSEDDRLTGLAMVGVYVSRARGEIFLTDADIEFMDLHQTTLALVVAGARAGFFARELDGTLQAVRSHEEFSVVDAVAKTAIPMPRGAEPERPVRHPGLAPRHPVRWTVAMIALLVVPVAAFAYLRPLLPQPPLELTLREISGQLVIGWNPQAVERGGRLEIVDQGQRTTLNVARRGASATYTTRGGDVEVRLAAGTRSGSARWVRARFVAGAIPPGGPAKIEVVRRKVAALEREARDLRKSIATRSAQVEELTRRANAIIKQ